MNLGYKKADGSTGHVPGYVVRHFDNTLPIIIDTEHSPRRGIFYVIAREHTGAAMVVPEGEWEAVGRDARYSARR